MMPRRRIAGGDALATIIDTTSQVYQSAQQWKRGTGYAPPPPQRPPPHRTGGNGQTRMTTVTALPTPPPKVQVVPAAAVRTGAGGAPPAGRPVEVKMGATGSRGYLRRCLLIYLR